MEKDFVMNALSLHLEEIQKKFDVMTLSLFGSVARGDAKLDSDIDLLVTYANSPGLFGFLDLKEYLEQILGCRVDLVTEKALKKQIRDKILKEAISVH